MKKSEGSRFAINISELRQRAEEVLRYDSEKMQQIPAEDIQKLVHELGVHQVELEMQNEELRRAKMEIDDLLSKYFELYELAPVGYFTFDQKGLVLEANLTGANLLGVQMRHLVKTAFSRFISPDFQDTFYFHRQSVFETGTQQTCELKLAKEDGTPFYVQLESIPVEENDGSFNQLRAAIIDITGRKQAEEGLQEAHDGLERRVEERTSDLVITNEQLKREIRERQRAEKVLSEREEQYRLLVQNLPAFVYKGFKDWSVQFFDQKIELLTGYSMDEFNSKKRRWSELIVEEDIETVQQDFIEALKTDMSYVREYRIRTKARDILWIQDRGQIVCNDKNEIEYVSGVFFDITDRKQLDTELLVYQDRLRSLASQLTLSEERERRRLAADLHDSIAQILAISKMKLDVVQNAAPSATIAATLAEVYDFIGQALEQTRNLTFELSPPELYELGLGAALEHLARRMQKRHGIRFELVEAESLKDLSEDLYVLLFRAVQELLINIVKHAQARNVRISIARDGGQVRLEVEDDGVGFDTSEEDDLQAEPGRFGLFSISERLRNVGGRFGIDAKPGRGTKVRVVVPSQPEILGG